MLFTSCVKKLIHTVTVILLVIVSSAHSAPMTLTHQGRLTDASGAALNGNFDITFRVCAPPPGCVTENADGLYSETQNVSVTNGFFSVIIGNIQPLDFSTFSIPADSLWLGIQIGSDAPLLPTTKLTSVPMAAVASSIQGDISTSQGVLYMTDSLGDTTIIWDANARKGTVDELHPPGNGTGTEIAAGYIVMTDSIGDSSIIWDGTRRRGMMKGMDDRASIFEPGKLTLIDSLGDTTLVLDGSTARYVELLIVNDPGRTKFLPNQIVMTDSLGDTTYQLDTQANVKVEKFQHKEQFGQVQQTRQGVTDSSSFIDMFSSNGTDSSSTKMVSDGSRSQLKTYFETGDVPTEARITAAPDSASINLSHTNGSRTATVTATVSDGGTALYMNKAELIDAISSGITDSVGSASLSRRGVRVGRNPQTGATINISANTILNDTSGGSFTLAYLDDDSDDDIIVDLMVNADSGVFRMNKAELVEGLASTIENKVQAFSISCRAARVGRNPQTGATINMSAQTHLNDTTGASFSLRRDTDSDNDDILDLRIDGTEVSLHLSKADAGKALNAFTSSSTVGISFIDSTLNDSGLIGITVTSTGGHFDMLNTQGDPTVTIEGGGGGSGGRIIVFTEDAGIGVPPGSVEIADLNSDGQMDIRIDGDLRIGTASGSNILTVVQSSLTDPIADAWTTYSSRRWKENITTIKNAVDKVQQLRGVEYDWKADGKHDIGLIAEEVGAVIPEVVVYEENGIDAKSVDYPRLVALLIEASKEQQTSINIMRKEIDELKLFVRQLANQKNNNGNQTFGNK